MQPALGSWLGLLRLAALNIAVIVGILFSAVIAQERPAAPKPDTARPGFAPKSASAPVIGPGDVAEHARLQLLIISSHALFLAHYTWEKE